jgi:hypothetical protein
MKFTPGTLIRVVLDESVDAKKAHVGDQVLAKTTDDLRSDPPGLVTKGCKIIGRVVEVTPHQGDTPSTVGIVFDKLILKNNSETALRATIQAVGFAVKFESATALIPQTGGAPGQYGGQRMPVPDSDSRGAKLPFYAEGAIGMSGVTLSAGIAQESILTSKKKNVKLEGGMQMILKTGIALF